MYMTRVMLTRMPDHDAIHSVISAAFPGKRDEKSNGYPWRVDNLEDGAALIIVSAGVPDIKHIVGKLGNGDARDKSLDYGPFLAEIDRGQTWMFRFCANPVEHKKTPGENRGKVYALRDIPGQLAWLGRQGASHGFTVNGCNIIGDKWLIFNETSADKNRNTVRIRTVTFDGALTVTDADVFRTALTKGIGRGKAYGCGLLTVAGRQA